MKQYTRGLAAIERLVRVTVSIAVVGCALAVSENVSRPCLAQGGASKPTGGQYNLRPENFTGVKPQRGGTVPASAPSRATKDPKPVAPPVVQVSTGDDVPPSPSERSSFRSANMEFEVTPALQALQSLETMPIDLAGAFALIGVQNPQFLVAQQRVLEASAQRQLAAAQLLPTLNLGGNFVSHSGMIQQPDGSIIKVSNQALFVGAGANAIGAGTVGIPGVVWNLNVSDTYFNYLVSRQVQAQREVSVLAVNNEVQLRVATAYLELVRALGQRSINWQAREEVADVARVTATFAKAGQGLPADANRALTELRNRDNEVVEADGQIVKASAQLAYLIGLDTAVRLVPTDRWAVPHSIVPEPIPLPELLTIAVLRRPELEEQRLDFSRALLVLDGAKMLPFSPNVFLGLSAGTFGGGSNLATAPTGSTPFGSSQERFGNFAGRADLDVMMFWSLLNMGVGNEAQILVSSSQVRQVQHRQMIVLDRVRAEVASAHIRVYTRYQQLKTAEEAVRESQIAFKEDLLRIRNQDGLPIEVLNSQRLLVRSRNALLNTIIRYNTAQFELYQALGQPPAEMLIRPSNEIDVIDVTVPSPEGK